MQATATLRGLLGPGKLHARIEDLKRTKGAPPWSEKVVVNDQIVGTLICQPPGHPTDRHYHLVDEWWGGRSTTLKFFLTACLIGTAKTSLTYRSA